MSIRIYAYIGFALASVLILSGCPQPGSTTDPDPGPDQEPDYWATAYGSAQAEIPQAITPANGGGYFVAGERVDSATEATTVFVMKLAADGAIEWQKSYELSTADDVAGAFGTSDGGVVLGGNTGIADAGGVEQDFYAMKLTSAGAVSWATAVDLDFDRADDENATVLFANSLQESGAGDILMGGIANLDSDDPGLSLSEQYEPMVIEVTDGGAPSAAYALDYEGFQDVGAVLHAGIDRYILVGLTEDSETGGATYFAARMDTDVASQTSWAVTFGTAPAVGSNVQAGWAFDGGFVVTGPYSGASAGIGSFKLSALDGSHTGTPYRSVPDSGAVVDGVHDMTEIANNDFVAIGTADTGTSRGEDVWLLRVDDDAGLPFSSTAIDGEGVDRGFAVAATPEGGIIAAGSTASGTSDDDDAYLLRGDPAGSIPDSSLSVVDTWMRYPIDSADIGTSVGPLDITTHSGSLFSIDVKADVSVTDTAFTVSGLYP